MRIFVGNPAPIEGAEVFLNEVSVGLTGADGSLAVVEVTAGSHTIRAEKAGYSPAEDIISVPETTVVTLILITLKFSISGSIWNAETGDALNAFEATLILDGVETPAWRSGNSFEIVDVPSGYHTLTTKYSGYGDWSWEGDVTSDISLDIRFTPLLYTVTVSVQGSGPIASASIYFDGAYVGLTDSAGSITITDVTAGSHTIRAEKADYSPDEKTISVPETTSVTLTLTPIAPPTYTVSVHVEGSGPIAGASVYFDYSYFGSTDSAGNISIGEVTEGWHNIWAEKAGYHSAGADIYVPRTTSVTLRMTPIAPPLGEIRVKVSMWVVGHLYPLSGAPIYLDGVFAGKADTDGLLTITGVSEGTHKVKVAPAALTPITKNVTVPDGYAAFVFYLP